MSSIGDVTGSEAVSHIDEVIRQLQRAKSDMLAVKVGTGGLMAAQSEDRAAGAASSTISRAAPSASASSGAGGVGASASAPPSSITPQSADFSAW
ncbi:hypothetical protein EON64_15010 [archaeon]|nr:MAG: hypothetical protein EON64_15010 [archaeon]